VNHSRSNLRSTGALALLALLPSCAAPEPRQALPLQSSPEFSPAGDTPLADRWWTAFGDERLNERVDLALTDNFTLAAAWERLREAEAITLRERSALYPSLDGTAGAELLDGSDIDDRSVVSLGLAASYELDLWGRIRSQFDAETLRTAATAEDYRTAAISLSSQVALTWYELAESRQQLELINSQIETNLTVLDVLEQRFAVGQSGSADVLRQRQLVEATREQAIVAMAEIEVFEHLLAVLEGRAPQSPDDVPYAPLPDVPEMPATGLPSELLERRPDIRSAFLRLEAADKDVAAAVASQYPRIDLAAAITTSTENPSGLFENWLSSIAAQLIAPLYDGDLRRAEVERTVAVRRRILSEYGQVVLDAFREIEDAIALEYHQVRRTRNITDQLELARLTYRQLRSQYLNGAADYLDVLAALREQQQLERSLLTAELDRVAFRIDLYRALAGGFDTSRELAEPNPYDDGEAPGGASASE